MSDNFDLKKFLKESKAIENLNPTFKSFNDVKSNETKKSLVENIKTKLNNIPLTEDKLREKIREMILAEMDNDSKEMDEELYEMDNMDEDNGYGSDDPRSLEDIEKKLVKLKDFSLSGYDRKVSSEINLLYSLYKKKGGKKTLANIAPLMEVEEPTLYEAKKDEEEVDIEDMPAEEEMAPEAEPAAPEDELSAAASSATGDSKELINHLMTSLDTAKAMGNEKLTTQILNTLKFAIDQSMGEN